MKGAPLPPPLDDADGRSPTDVQVQALQQHLAERYVTVEQRRQVPDRFGAQGDVGFSGDPFFNLRDFFFSSGMADVALWLGPYMSINCQNYICTRTQKVHKCRQIKSHQTTHKTHNQDDPQIPQPDLRFVKKNSKPDRQRGKSPNNKTHKKDLPRDTADFTTVSHSKTCIN